MNPNQTRAQLVEQIDWERRENNAKFVSPDQTVKLMNRAVQVIIREPGIRTISETAFITASDGMYDYDVPGNFKEVTQLLSGSGAVNALPFHYLPVEEWNLVISGYCYTFRHRNKISIKFPDVNTLPNMQLQLDYWISTIVLDVDGTTEKTTWDNDGDTFLTPPAYDDFIVAWVVSRILRREGKKEWKDYDQEAKDILESLKEAPATKTRRPMKAFGHYMGQTGQN